MRFRTRAAPPQGLTVSADWPAGMPAPKALVSLVNGATYPVLETYAEVTAALADDADDVDDPGRALSTDLGVRFLHVRAVIRADGGPIATCRYAFNPLHILSFADNTPPPPPPPPPPPFQLEDL